MSQQTKVLFRHLKYSFTIHNPIHRPNTGYLQEMNGISFQIFIGKYSAYIKQLKPLFKLGSKLQSVLSQYESSKANFHENQWTQIVSIFTAKTWRNFLVLWMVGLVGFLRSSARVFYQRSGGGLRRLRGEELNNPYTHKNWEQPVTLRLFVRLIRRHLDWARFLSRSEH